MKYIIQNIYVFNQYDFLNYKNFKLLKPNKMNLKQINILIESCKKDPENNKEIILYYEKKRIELIKQIESTIKTRLKNQLNINI